jgi:hypothetical protein
MKNNILKFIGFFVLVAFLASCDKEAFEEYSSVPADAAPALTVTIDSFTDSTITVSYSMTGAGRVTLAVMPTSIGAPTVSSLEKRSIKEDDYNYLEYFKHEEGSASGTMTYDGLKPNTSYTVYGIGHNLDGVASEMITSNTIKTLDFANPIIAGLSPGKGSSDVAIDKDIVITFSENVTYVAGKVITVFSDFGPLNEVITADNILVEGNKVTINCPDFPFEDYINLTMEAGTFIDEQGNECGAINAYPTAPNYWFETRPEIYFDNITGHYYVISENEIGFGDGESGGYWLDIERTGEYELTIYNLTFTGAELVLTLNPDDKSIVVANQSIGITAYGEDVMARDTDPYGVGEGSGIVPGSYDEETGELIFFANYYISLGNFGFYTYQLKPAIPSTKTMILGPQDNRVLKVRKF